MPLERLHPREHPFACAIRSVRRRKRISTCVRTHPVGKALGRHALGGPAQVVRCLVGELAQHPQVALPLRATSKHQRLLRPRSPPGSSATSESCARQWWRPGLGPRAASAQELVLLVLVQVSHCGARHGQSNPAHPTAQGPGHAGLSASRSSSSSSSAHDAALAERSRADIVRAMSTPSRPCTRRSEEGRSGQGRREEEFFGRAPREEEAGGAGSRCVGPWQVGRRQVRSSIQQLPPLCALPLQTCRWRSRPTGRQRSAASCSSWPARTTSTRRSEPQRGAAGVRRADGGGRISVVSRRITSRSWRRWRVISGAASISAPARGASPTRAGTSLRRTSKPCLTPCSTPPLRS